MPARILLVFFFGLLTLSSACYVGKCPRRGKRSKPEIRQCMSCGPNNRGICFGPRICCLSDQGCQEKTDWSTNCPDEDLNPIPCEGSKIHCGEDGRCGYTGVCCNAEICFASTEC